MESTTKFELGPNQKAWIEALRSNKFTQAGGALCSDKGYCCLGVLCEVNDIPKKRQHDSAVFIFNTSKGVRHMSASLPISTFNPVKFYDMDYFANITDNAIIEKYQKIYKIEKYLISDVISLGIIHFDWVDKINQEVIKSLKQIKEPGISDIISRLENYPVMKLSDINDNCVPFAVIAKLLDTYPQAFFSEPA